MLRLIIAVVLTALVVAFGMSNGHQVPVSFVIGAPIQVRQIFLLATALATGIVGTLLAQQYNRAKKLRESRILAASASTRKPPDGDDLADD